MTDSLQYYTILTNKGLEYEANCLSTDSEFHITHIGVGDGNGSEITPSVNQTTLVHEIKRYAVFNEEIDTTGGLYYAAIQIPASDGGFTIRELGGYNANGDLVMVAKFPPTEKRVQTTGDYRRTFIRMDLSIVNERTFPSVIDSSLAFPSTEYVTNQLTQLSEDLTINTDNKIADVLEIIYPVGSIYIGMTPTCPISALFGTWELILGGLTLQQADNINTVGTEIPAGLPNITGDFNGAELYDVGSGQSGPIAHGAFGIGGSNSRNTPNVSGDSSQKGFNFYASRSSSIYGSADTVQPPALAVNIWQRTA